MTKRRRLPHGKSFDADKKGMNADAHRSARAVESFLGPNQTFGIRR
jgi:hypothetical protein